MQGPGRADEDTRDGFTRGGWAEPDTDDTMTAAWGRRLGAGGAYLFGRRTYEDVLGHWNSQEGPFGDALHIMGSGALIRSLVPVGAIDEYLLCIHPLVLGTGHRLFADGFVPTTLELIDATPTTKGVIIATYRPVRSSRR